MVKYILNKIKKWITSFINQYSTIPLFHPQSKSGGHDKILCFKLVVEIPRRSK
jgi:hypothetical protein